MTREELYNTMVIKQTIMSGSTVIISNVPAEVDRIVARIKSNQVRYELVSHHFINPGLKWWLVAIIHYLECGLNFNCYLGNGQVLSKKTTIKPIGRGPFPSFTAGAIDAIVQQGIDKVTDWSIGNILYILEKYNGFGYEDDHGINSPYLWSGTNHYEKGKYVSDDKYDPNYVSNQIGAAVLLQRLLM